MTCCFIITVLIVFLPYSTIITENESVVAELLRNSKGGLELVDARQFLPLFKTRPGLSQWVVLDDYFAIKRESKERRVRMQQQNQEKQQKLAAEAKAAAAADGDAVVDTDATVSEESVVVVAVDEDAVKSVEKSETDMEVVTTDNTTIPVATTTTTSSADETTQQQPSIEEEDEAAQSHDFSHIEDAALRHCLEMGMRLYPDAASVPSHLDKRIRRSLFPPTAEEREWMHLGERICIHVCLLTNILQLSVVAVNFS